MKASNLAGQLVVGGFSGTSLSPSFRAALARGERAGAILFKRNIETWEGALTLSREIAAAAPPDVPPLVCVDQEGGRVARLRAPALVLPPMRLLAERASAALMDRAATAQARELAALGFTMNFSPILDVDTNPENPIIGDRSFSRDPEKTASLAIAWAAATNRGGVLACGKHFPGHGDTKTDSHLELPRVEHDLARVTSIELLPFRRAAAAGIDSLMTAHVVFDALDPRVPATQSHAICTDLLRGELAFRGVLFSDDLEMKAIREATGDAALSSIRAGCDLLLVCSDEARQEEAVASLAKEIEASPAFRERCEEAHGRALAMRRRVPPRPLDEDTVRARFAEHASLQSEITELAR